MELLERWLLRLACIENLQQCAQSQAWMLLRSCPMQLCGIHATLRARRNFAYSASC